MGFMTEKNEPKFLDFSIKEVRRVLWNAYKELGKFKSKNKLKRKYLAKIRLMLLWLRLISFDKEFIEKWRVYDLGDFYRIKKGEEEKDIKSAVEGLLQEIDKKLVQREGKLIKSKYEEGFVDGYKCACYEIIKKIKKWFADVVEE